MDPEQRTAFFRGAADSLVAGVPPEDREKLTVDVAQLLGSSRPTPEPAPAPPPAASPRRLTLILDRLDSSAAQRANGRNARPSS